jgi:hypothetical protein
MDEVVLTEYDQAGALLASYTARGEEKPTSIQVRKQRLYGLH